MKGKGTDWGGSVIKTFQNCKRRHYLEQEYPHPDGGQGLMQVRDSYASSLGTILHVGLQTHYDFMIHNDTRPYAERAVDAIHTAVNLIDELELKDEDKSLMRDEVTAYLDQYFQYYEKDPDGFVPYTVEESVALHVGDFVHTGSIDITGLCGSYLVVGDHKSTSLTWDKFFRKWKFDISLRGYAYHKWKTTGNMFHIMINGVRRLKNKAFDVEFKRDLIILTEDDFMDFERTVLHERQHMEMCRRAGFWPRSSEACVEVWGVCEMDPI